MAFRRLRPEVLKAGIVLLSAAITLMPATVATAAEGNPNYLGILSSTPPTGFTPSPSIYSLAQGQNTLTFDLVVTNLTSETKSMNLELDLDHITTYPINGVPTDISDGQPGVVNGVIVDGQFNEMLATEVQDPNPTIIPFSIGPNETKTLHFTRTLAAGHCGYFQVDVAKQGLTSQKGLAGFEIRVLGCGAPSISTTAAPTTGVVGDPIHDSATVTSTISPTGTVSFSLFGPGDSSCATDLVSGNASFKNIALVAGSATSPNFTTTQAGTYNWIARYNGDVNNAPVASACGAEAVVIQPTTPGIRTTASPTTAAVGALIHDSATLSGGASPTGTITFSLFGPGDTTCATNLVAGVGGFINVPLSGLSATSANYATTQVGTYNWIATYNGDSNNNPVSSNCGDEAVVIQKATPSIATVAVPTTGPVGTVISDTAAVSGGFSPTGTVTFRLFGPGDSTCAGASLVSGAGFVNVPLSGLSASSGGFHTTVAGTYNWVATYNGDANNNAVSSHCGDEAVVISKPLGGQGCTPGFWKNPKHFSLWTGVTPGQSVGSVFSVPATFPDGSSGSTLASATLADGLAFQGGSDLNGAAQILLRAAIAGVLNANNPNVAYSLTASQIISSVNSALASGDRNTILNLATQIDNANNGQAGCPLS